MLYDVRFNKKTFNIFVTVCLILSIIGVSPGVVEFFNTSPSAVYASQPFSEKEISLPDETKVELKEAASATQQILAESDATFVLMPDEIEKKEMHAAEEVAWSVARALLPTLAVMAFSAAAVLPLGWVVVGSVLVGAATAGVLSFIYEQRKNHFRDEDSKKSMDRIMRDVTISAAVSGATAPFSMLSAGFAQAIGPVTTKTIIQGAAKMGLTSFLGSTVSNVTKAAVTNLWYHNYYNYGDQERSLKEQIAALEAKSELTPEEAQQLSDSLKQLDALLQEKYTIDNFRQDQKKALLGAAISGVVGGAAGRMSAEAAWAKTASSKLFGSTAHAGTIANAVVSNPFAFATGVSSASLDRQELLREIAINRQKQASYEVGSVPYEYYEEKIADLEEAYKNVNVWARGRDSMFSNAAMQAAVLTTSLVKARVFDLPSEKQKKIQDAYEKDDPLWQEANEARKELEIFSYEKPVAEDYNSLNDYLTALRRHEQQLDLMRENYEILKVQAAAAQQLPQNEVILENITKEVELAIEHDRQLDLARALGRDSFVQFMESEIRNNPDNTGLADDEIAKQAVDAVNNFYEEAAKKNAINLAKMQDKLDTRNETLEASIERTADGTRVIAVKDSEGNIVGTKPWEGGEGAYWFDKLTKDPAKMQDAEIKRAVDEIYNSASMVKPSAYRTTFVNMRVNQLRAQGLTDTQIEHYLPQIIDEANVDTLNSFGGSWQNVTKSEILAAGLERAKYDDGEAPDISSILKFLRGQLPNQTVSVFKNQLNAQLNTQLNTVASKIVSPVDFGLTARDERALNQLADKYLQGNR